MNLIFKFLLCFLATASARCPIGYTHSNDSVYEPTTCYLNVDIPEDFYTARLNCSAIAGGHLAYVTRASTNAFLQGLLNASMTDTNTHRWLGAIQDPHNNKWFWGDGTPVQYTNWAQGEPSDSNLCMSMLPSSGEWYASACTTKYPYICSASETDEVLAATAACDSLWTWLNATNMCYRVFYNQNASNAEATCQSNGAHLVSIHSTFENNFVQTLAMSGFFSGDQVFQTWIGIGDPNGDAVYTWTDGTPVDYTNWLDENPNYPNLAECTAMYSDYIGYFGKWYSYGCSNSMRAFVCKKASLLNRNK